MYAPGFGARISVGNHDTVRAQSSLENIKWVWSPNWRWSRHPDKSRDTLYSNWIPCKIPISRLQRSGSKTGYGLCLAHPTFRLASVCVYILLPFDYLVISLLLFSWHVFHFYFYQICTLVLLMLFYPWQ